jgi:hypothetical protein
MYNRPTPLHAIVTAAMVTGALLGSAGCSSDEGATSGPACDDAAIAQAIETSLMGTNESVLALEGVSCSGEWAVGFPAVAVGEMDFIITSVLRAEADSWVVVADRNEVCGTLDPAGDVENPAYPSDAQVPEAIWRDACYTN